MSTDRFVSYGQNNEDVVLWRALGSIRAGFYVDVGANEPVLHSVTKAFYDRGWSGINIEPLPDDARRLEAERPRDHTVQAAITSAAAESITIHMFAGTGLSTLDDSLAKRHARSGFSRVDIEVPALSLSDVLEKHQPPNGEIHFLKIDVEGAEADVLASVDLRRWRPWVVVVEATAPLTNEPTHAGWEPTLLTAGYRFCLFDGLSRFYLAEEHADLGATLSYPACVLDDFIGHAALQLESTNSALFDDLVRWRGAALQRWAEGPNALAAERAAARDARNAASHAQEELDRTRSTLSWRLTRPLRALQTMRQRRVRR